MDVIVSILLLIFIKHVKVISDFIQCYPLGSSYLVGKSVKYRYIEFFVFDYNSLPISFQSGITFFL